ncbi:hypothetical protein [Moheibacter sediminis]|nr:hypothetical protein [Moheibacter sediminis]
MLAKVSAENAKAFEKLTNRIAEIAENSAEDAEVSAKFGMGMCKT